MKNTNYSNRKNKKDSAFLFIIKTIFVSGLIVTAGVGLIFVYFTYYKQGTAQTTSFAPLLSKTEETLPIQPSTMDRVKLFFTKDGLHLTPQIIEMESNQADYDKIRFITENLQRGPMASSLRSVIPNNCKIANIFILKDKIVVNIECEQSRPRFGSITDEMLCVYSIVNSIILNYNKISTVQILINGKINETFGDFVDIHSPLAANFSLIK